MFCTRKGEKKRSLWLKREILALAGSQTEASKVQAERRHVLSALEDNDDDGWMLAAQSQLG